MNPTVKTMDLHVNYTLPVMNANVDIPTLSRKAVSFVVQLLLNA
jgi:hypothetical protein